MVVFQRLPIYDKRLFADNSILVSVHATSSQAIRSPLLKLFTLSFTIQLIVCSTGEQKYFFD